MRIARITINLDEIKRNGLDDDEPAEVAGFLKEIANDIVSGALVKEVVSVNDATGGWLYRVEVLQK